jgi:2-succinyl-6-hydroxy-2,4-cyclohexadiene-1-carboxylate synthase
VSRVSASGAAVRTRVVALHGFAGHAESWSAVRAALAALGGRPFEAITSFGHEPTSPPRTAIAFQDEVDRIAAAIRSMGAPVRVCGYSMGGRVALGLLATAPELVESAVIVGAHPGLTTDAERQQRIAGDELWVRILEDEGIEAFTTKWQAQPLFASQERLPPDRLAQQRAVRLRHDPHGLALAMSSLGLGRMPSYWEALDRAQVPVHLVVGGEDAKFAALAARMKERLPPALGAVHVVEGAGHNVLLERPERLAELIAALD